MVMVMGWQLAVRIRHEEIKIKRRRSVRMLRRTRMRDRTTMGGGAVVGAAACGGAAEMMRIMS
jgi:hypothetical protein